MRVITDIMSHHQYRDEDIKPVEFKVKFNPIPKTNLKSFKQLFPAYEEGLMRSEPGGFVMPPNYCENAEKIFRMQPRKDDVWLVTFPKSGDKNSLKF